MQSSRRRPGERSSKETGKVVNLQDIAEWVAPAATMIAATMTAANLGTRVTGWGFVVFTVGSISWCAIGSLTGQTELLVTNVFLTIVNLIGVYRWLGRQARFEDGGKAASRQSEKAGMASLFSANSSLGAKVVAEGDEEVGTIVDLMLEAGSNDVNYAVVTDGGVAGIEEKLRAVGAADLEFADGSISYRGTAEQFANIAIIDDEAWPASKSVHG